ncbi:hypothetical protein KCMC57_up34340 [Kitasatospora sp. CMC57]|uniref:Tetracycline repressor TetR C-terminal domain-containing protein n=1 Tax=Kitasatospora sp. CMC57 TaxID=3231513 RepID=A0AB33K589_9ACTN
MLVPEAFRQHLQAAAQEDPLFLGMPRSVDPMAPWRERVTAVAESNRVLYLAHPWVAALPATRLPLGPGLIAKYEHELSAFDGLGLPDLDVDAALIAERAGQADRAARG